VFLETKRLFFRSHEPGDEAAFVRMQGDVDFRRYVGGTAWPAQKARKRFREQYVGREREPYGLWATILKESGEYIGCCGLVGDAPAPHLAYYIARPFWGRGFATEAASALVTFGFEDRALPRIVATVEKGHRVSEHILEKLGFHIVRDETIAHSARIISYYELTCGSPQRTEN
jgi:RimJ/RimL family protein N-acetyltransferase